MCVIKCACVLTCVLCVHNKSSMLVASWSLLPSLPSRIRSTLCIYSQEKHMCAGTTWVCPLCKGRHFHSPGVLQLVAGARRRLLLTPSALQCIGCKFLLSLSLFFKTGGTPLDQLSISSLTWRPCLRKTDTLIRASAQRCVSWQVLGNAIRV